MTKPIRKFKIDGWQDNYYANLLDWSYNNFIGVANNQNIFFYNMALDNIENQVEKSQFTRKYHVSCHLEYINAIHFSQVNTKIMVGYNYGSLVLFDYFKDRKLHVIKPHSERISCI